MYNYILKIISESIKKDKRLYPKLRIEEEIFIVVVFLKHMCEKGKLRYENVKNDSYKQIIDHIKKDFSIEFDSSEIDIERIFKFIKDKNSIELIEEMFEYHKNTFGISIIDNNVKKVCIIYDNDINAYDRYGNTIYLNRNFFDRCVFKLLDYMLDVKNEYVQLKKQEILKTVNNKDYIIPNNIDYVYISNDISYSRMYEKEYKNEIETITNNLLNEEKQIIVKANYRNISYIDPNYLPKIDKFILSNVDDKSIIYFNPIKDKDVISIILYDNETIKNINFLKEIVKENKENENYLIKVSEDTILDNNCRIGFKLYKKRDDVEKTKTMNDIVDDNNRLILNLKQLNLIIETEMDKLINK